MINNTKDLELLARLEDEYIDRVVRPDESFDLIPGEYIIVENNDY
jgi:hypothetical protein